jgi:recombination protein RecT
MNNIVAKKDQTFSAFVNSPTGQTMIARVINNPKNRERFVAHLMSVVSNNPELAACDKMSLISSAFMAQSLNLSLAKELGHAWVIPYNKKDSPIKHAQLQIGYKGYIQMAMRTGAYKRMNAIAIKQGEFVSWNPLTEELSLNLVEDEDIRNNLPDVGYVALFELLNGFKKVLYWTYSKMESHAKKYSKGYSKFWGKNSETFEEMALKTIIQHMIKKWGVITSELESALKLEAPSEEEQETLSPMPVQKTQPTPIAHQEELTDDTESLFNE